MKERDLWWRWALVIVWMAMIFWFSHEPGDASDVHSNFIVEWLQSIGLTWTSDILALVVRKTAHMTEYAVLAILVFVAVQGTSGRGRTLIEAFVLTVVYAATDEVHQLVVPGRTGKLSDVLIDATGAAIGLALAWWVSRRRDQRRERESTMLSTVR